MSACGWVAKRGKKHTVTWSIHTRSQLLRVMASPPQTYLGLSSVILMFWMMTLLAPLTTRRPRPLMTPLLPEPMRLLLLVTVMPSVAAAL